MKFQNYMNGQYHQYSDKKHNGMIYKCQSPSSELPVTITLYPSTSDVHMCKAWVHQSGCMNLLKYRNSSCMKTAASYSQRHYVVDPATSYNRCTGKYLGIFQFPGFMMSHYWGIDKYPGI